MQVTQGVRRDAWRPERHCGANPGVEHPLPEVLLRLPASISTWTSGPPARCSL